MKTRRNTHQKALILSAVSGIHIHRTAEEVLEIVKKEDPNIGLATVYRNLNLFVEEKRIQRVSGDGWSYFDGNPKPHDHLHCKMCGNIFDLTGPYNAKLDRDAESVIGGRVLSHSTTYEGICFNCLKKSEFENEEKKERKNV